MRTIDVTETIDKAPFGAFQWTVVVLCALLLIADGYDVFIAGTVLPTLISEWSLSKPEAGALQAWALFGMMFGALFFGPLADKIGRKKGIAISFLLFSASTLLTGFSGSPFKFKLFRFLADFGLGIWIIPQYGGQPMFFAAAISAFTILIYAVSNARCLKAAELASA